MAGPVSGWARLGDALGGDSELEYQKGLSLGANTENALSQASERRTKALALSENEENLVAAGFSRPDAKAAANLMTSGQNLGDLFSARKTDQEIGFRNEAANPGTPFERANRLALAWSSGPTDRYQKVGNGADDRFDAAGIQPLPGGVTEGGGAAGAIQVLRSFGLLDEHDRVLPGMEERAFDVMRSTERNTDFGGVPGVTTANPYHKGPKAAPVSDPTTVGGNAGEIARQTEIGKGAGVAQNALPDQLADISKLRDSVNGLLGAKGFEGVYGNIQGQPGVRTLMGLADEDVQDAQIRLKNIDAQTFGVAVQKMRGLGQLSNAEGTKVTDAYTRAVDPRSSAEDARMAWNEVLDGLDLAEARAKRKAQVSTLPPAAAAPNPGSAPNSTPAPSQPAGKVRMLNGKKYVETSPGQWFEDDGT